MSKLLPIDSSLADIIKSERSPKKGNTNIQGKFQQKGFKKGQKGNANYSGKNRMQFTPKQQGNARGQKKPQQQRGGQRQQQQHGGKRQQQQQKRRSGKRAPQQQNRGSFFSSSSSKVVSQNFGGFGRGRGGTNTTTNSIASTQQALNIALGKLEKTAERLERVSTKQNQSQGPIKIEERIPRGEVKISINNKSPKTQNIRTSSNFSFRRNLRGGKSTAIRSNPIFRSPLQRQPLQRQPGIGKKKFSTKPKQGVARTILKRFESQVKQQPGENPRRRIYLSSPMKVGSLNKRFTQF